MNIDRAVFNRTRLLVGDDGMSRLSEAKVIILGVGGVGSWCAEALIRSGVRHLTIVDSDRVCVTNINRQLMANISTVGKVKVEALKEQLLLINPSAQIETRQAIFCQETADSFNLQDYDYIVDCIDSLKDKILLILMATRTKARFYSSMGAALKMDPTRIKVAEFWKVQGCPLARMIRKRMKGMKRFPSKKFKCVFSDEVLENKGRNEACGTGACMCPKSKATNEDSPLHNHEWCSSKAQINGTMMHITAMFGLILGGLVIEDILKES